MLAHHRRERLAHWRIADAEQDAILYADIDIVASRSALIWSEFNDLARDRRTDLYQPLLGYTGGIPLPR